MNELSTITSKLIDSVKMINKEHMYITVMLIDFSSQFDDEHQALYAER
jgi:hypothetical protein